MMMLFSYQWELNVSIRPFFPQFKKFACLLDLFLLPQNTTGIRAESQAAIIFHRNTLNEEMSTSVYPVSNLISLNFFKASIFIFSSYFGFIMAQLSLVVLVICTSSDPKSWRIYVPHHFTRKNYVVNFVVDSWWKFERDTPKKAWTFFLKHILQQNLAAIHFLI